MTLVEFLLARLAEDEVVARAVFSEPLCPVDERGRWEMVGYDYEGEAPQPLGSLAADDRGRGCDPGWAWTDLVNRFDPARVLAEVEAKRRIVEHHSNPDVCGHYDPPAVDADPCYTLQFLAAIYADHPDFREEWRLDRIG